jgi:ATP-binding cassette, subfamily B, bacterial
MQTMNYQSTVKAVIQLVWRASPGFFMGLVCLTLITGLTPVLSILIASRLIDMIVGMISVEPAVPFRSFTWILILYGGVVLAEQLSIRLRAAMERLYQIRVTNYIQCIIADHAASLDLAFFENPDFHNKLRNAATEASYRPLAMITQIMAVTSGLMTMVSMAVILLTWQAWIVPPIVVAAAVMFFVSARFGSANVHMVMGRTPEARKAQYLNALMTSDSVAKDIRLFGLREYFLRIYRGLQETMYQQDSRLIRKQAFWTGLWEALLAAIRPLLIGYTAVQAIQRIVTVGQFNLYTQSIIQLHNGLYSLMATMAQLYENNLFVSNLFQFLAIEPEVEATRNTGALLPVTRQPTIEFRHVSFRYPGTAKTVLNDLNLCIHPGETLALVGDNGAGKTTLVKLLTGLYKPTEGQILFDGVDIALMDRHYLRAHLSVIFQDYPIYHFSLHNNIAFGRISEINSPEAVYEAARRTGLDKLALTLPHGYETILGRWFERGHELSGGQRQLVALTRAVMRRADTMILDEPTAALDVYAEREFFNRLMDEKQTHRQTILFISHRFSTVRQADRIIVLEGGRIVEEGSHESLMAANGLYAEMFTSQAEMYGLPKKNGQVFVGGN